MYLNQQSLMHLALLFTVWWARIKANFLSEKTVFRKKEPPKWSNTTNVRYTDIWVELNIHRHPFSPKVTVGFCFEIWEKTRTHVFLRRRSTVLNYSRFSKHSYASADLWTWSIRIGFSFVDFSATSVFISRMSSRNAFANYDVVEALVRQSIKRSSILNDLRIETKVYRDLYSCEKIKRFKSFYLLQFDGI